jgi:DNA-binding transcriptional ArsR family regulator
MVEQKNTLLEAMLDERRLRLLNSLRKGQMYIGELATAVSLDRATVAYHLSVLEAAGLVTSKYELLEPPHSPGLAARYYAINEDKLKEALQAVRGLLP